MSHENYKKAVFKGRLIMITDNQAKKLRSTFMNPKSTVQTSALKINVCENTARKYLQKENWLPSEIIAERPPRFCPVHRLCYKFIQL